MIRPLRPDSSRFDVPPAEGCRDASSHTDSLARSDSRELLLSAAWFFFTVTFHLHSTSNTSSGDLVGHQLDCVRLVDPGPRIATQCIYASQLVGVSYQ